ncbi:MAG TPA: class I SAM-dependent methyltransferase [Candidatus Saccharimonadales bacterium]|nr:class I SAM-dependent methyltransferase [Candidatus Saccharimonadales bacterium]
MSSKKTNEEFFGHFWNENMIDYLSHSAGSRWFAHLLSKMLQELPAHQIKSVADIGCGVGNKTAQLATHFKHAEVIGYDFSEPAIEAAKKHYKIENLKFATEDITNAKHKKKVDLITAFEVLEHIEHWEDLAKKLININTKYMMISVPVGRMRPYEVHIGHYRNYKRGQIEKFMEDHGYRTVKTFYAGFPFYSPIVRNITNASFSRGYTELPQNKMSFLAKRMHDIWYILFRYASLRNRGDTYIGLFEATSK